MRKDVLLKYKEAVASILHDEWRKPRLRPDGSYEPRPKIVNGTTYDIANLSFPELPAKVCVCVCACGCGCGCGFMVVLVVILVAVLLLLLLLLVVVVVVAVVAVVVVLFFLLVGDGAAISISRGATSHSLTKLPCLYLPGPVCSCALCLCLCTMPAFLRSFHLACPVKTTSSKLRTGRQRTCRVCLCCSQCGSAVVGTRRSWRKAPSRRTTPGWTATGRGRHRTKCSREFFASVVVCGFWGFWCVGVCA